MPEVAVIIPCYNDGIYLREALASLEAQTYNDWEAILVDDGSTDEETLALLASISSPKVRVIYHESNRGLAAARNTGIEASNATYICPLDADDRFDMIALEEYVKAFKADKDIGLVYSQVQRFGFDQRLMTYPREIDLRFLVEQYHPVATSPFSRDAWVRTGGLCEHEILRIGMEDVDFHFSLLELGVKFSYVSKPLYHYRSREMSLSGRMQTNNYKIRKFIANRHKSLLKGSLRSVYLHLGAVREFRALVYEQRFFAAISSLIGMFRQSMFSYRLLWRTLWEYI